MGTFASTVSKMSLRVKSKLAAITAVLLVSTVVNPALAVTGPAAVADTPTAIAYASTPAANSFDVLANDVASDGESFDTSTLLLCGDGQTPDTCSNTSLTNSDGTYDVTTSLGQITFTPATYFFGSATPITYQVTDSIGAVVSSTLSVSVTAPTKFTTVADTKTAKFNETITIDVLDNDTVGGEEVDNSTVAICASSVTEASSCTQASVESTGKGTFDVITGGSVTFTPVTDFAGPVTAIKYVVKDKAGQYSNLSTITATVVALPTVTNDTSSKVINSDQTVSPLTNDAVASNGVGVTLSAGTLALCGDGETVPNCTSTSATNAGEGSVSLTGSVVTYTPETDYQGTSVFTYQVGDSLGQVVSATITFTTTAVPAGSSATDDTSSANYDVTQSSINVLANDVPADGETFTASTVKLCNGTEVDPAHCAQTTVTVANTGVFTVNAGGTITFNPDAKFAGVYSINYEVTDSASTVVRGSLEVTVNAPTAGVAHDDTKLAKFNETVTVSVLTNDVKGGANLDVAAVKLCTDSTATEGCDQDTLTVDGEGVYTVNVDGTIEFAPEADISGVQTDVAYEAFDITGQSAGTALLTVTVVDLPTATADTSSGASGETQTVSPLDNDSVSDLADGAGVSLNAASLQLCGVSPVQEAPDCNKTSLTLDEGVVSIVAGDISFVPAADYSGDLVVTYQVADSLGQAVNGTVAFSVIAPAEAIDDTSSDDYNVVQTIDVLANDTPTTNATFDATSLVLCDGTEDGDPCALDTVEVANVGTFAAVEGQIEFTPLETYSGTTTIRYEISDDSPATVGANLTVTVNAPEFPELTDDESADDFDVNQTVDVLANDTLHGADLDPATVFICGTLLTDCTHSSLMVTGVGYFSVDAETGEITLNPSYKFWGDATIHYVVSDITGQTALPAAVVFTVNEPAAESINGDLSAGAPEAVQTIDVLKNDRPGTSKFDLTSVKLCNDDQTAAEDCDLTTYTVDGEGTYAVATGGKITFTPEAAFVGEAQTLARYTVEVTDHSRIGIGSIQVAVLEAPTGTDDSSTKAYDVNHSIDVSANDDLGELAIKYEVGFDYKSIRLCGPEQEAPVCDFKKLIIPSVGIFTVDVLTGKVLFNPSASYAGTADPVVYQISNTIGQVASAELAVNVDFPAIATLVNDTSFAGVKSTQIISVLKNDIRGEAYLNPATVRICDDGEGAMSDPCSLKSLVVEDFGTFTVKTDGTIQYVPLASATDGYVLPAIDYQVADVTGQVMVPATLTVTAVGHAVSVNDTATVAYNTKAITNLLTNDTLTDEATDNGVTFATKSIRICPLGVHPPNCASTTLTVDKQGAYILNINTGVVTFTPLKTFSGLATAITYQVRDSLGQVSSATYRVTVSNPAAATLNNDSGWTKFATKKVFNVAKNDVAGGAALVAKSVRLCATAEVTAATCSKTTLTVAGEGTYKVSSKNGKVTFVPAASFDGVASAVRYSIADITGYRSAIATLTATVVGKPEPVADNESADYLERAVFTPLVNDDVSELAASKGVTLVAASIKLCASGQRAGNCDATKVKVAGQGTWVLNPTTHRVTFVPLATFAGSTTALKYQVSDSLGQTQTANLVAEIGQPAPSILVDDNALAGVAIAKTIKVLANDLSVGSAIAPTTVKLCSQAALVASACSLNTLTVTGEGTYTVDAATGAITFKSVAAFTGAATTVSYTVADITGQKASMAAISITVVDGPTLVADTSSDDYDVNQTAAVLENDTLSDLEDANGVEIKASTLRLCDVGQSAPNCSLEKLTVKGEGVYTVNHTTDSIVFNPDATFTGATKPVKYQVKDTLGNAETATVIFTVGTATIGTLTADVSNVLQGLKLVVNVLANDTVGDAPYKAATVRLCGATELTGAACSLTSLTVAGEGTYKVDVATGKISFVSTGAFTGLATAVRYTVADITGQKAVPVTLTITVNAVL